MVYTQHSALIFPNQAKLITKYVVSQYPASTLCQISCDTIAYPGQSIEFLYFQTIHHAGSLLRYHLQQLVSTLFMSKKFNNSWLNLIYFVFICTQKTLSMIIFTLSLISDASIKYTMHKALILLIKTTLHVQAFIEATSCSWYPCIHKLFSKKGIDFTKLRPHCMCILWKEAGLKLSVSMNLFLV